MLASEAFTGSCWRALRAVTGLVLVLVVAFVWPRADASFWLRAPLGLAPVQLLQVCCTLEVVFIAPFWLTYCGMPSDVRLET